MLKCAGFVVRVRDRWLLRGVCVLEFVDEDVEIPAFGGDVNVLRSSKDPCQRCNVYVPMLQHRHHTHMTRSNTYTQTGKPWAIQVGVKSEDVGMFREEF